MIFTLSFAPWESMDKYRLQGGEESGRAAVYFYMIFVNKFQYKWKV